jgi:aspartate carbamoyltransferase catalytic subunit
MPYRSLLSVLDLSLKETAALLDAAEAYLPRVEAGGFKDDTLKGCSALLLFYEPSTRTRASFELAGKMLGMDTINVGATASSIVKGEGVKDTALTLNAMHFNVVVMRHNAPDAVALFARHFERATLNAGSGRGQHPTQALLDALILRDAGVLKRGKHLAVVGDLKHSRVMRSNLQLLARHGLAVTLVAPPPLMPAGWEGLKPEHWADAPADCGAVTWRTDFDSVLPELDAVMMLRVQRERLGEALLTSADEYSKLYGLSRRRLRLLRDDAVILHPGPVNRGVEVTEDVFADPRCRINDQVTGGLALRCALLRWACGKLDLGKGGKA